MTMNLHSFGAGLILAASALSGPAPDHADMRVGALHAGSTRADVQRVLGEPTAATALGDPAQADVALLYADEPVRTRVTLTAGKVTAIALDVVYVDPAPLPARARTVKATMLRDGVTRLLGCPAADVRWTDTGRDVEQLTFAREGEPDFSVFLVNDLVVDVRLGRDRPAGLASMLLPAAIADGSVGSELAIGLSPAQVAPAAF
jgi:hypothetical protein